MPSQKPTPVTLFATLALVVTAASVHALSQEKVLYAFNGGADGLSPTANLTFDTAGNLYGTTFHGGDYQCDSFSGCGTVFKLELGTDGKWSKRVLHIFHGEDGAYPNGMIFDGAGNLYGTALTGGGTQGYGVVFKLTRSVIGPWKETILHTFRNKDGGLPAGSLVFDSVGNLYGTTQTGGNLNACGGAGCGTVFELTQGGDKKWTMTVLHAFKGNDGSNPTCTPILDPVGNLYGTTSSGGASGYGTVFEIKRGPNGRWIGTVLHFFDGRDGAEPYAGLVFDSAGNLYGTTQFGGDLNSFYCGGVGCGTVFKLAPGPNGKWIPAVIHAFNGVDGMNPLAGLMVDAAGNLYGTTFYNYGVVFELSQDANNRWMETVLHVFQGQDGLDPVAGLVSDSLGNLYGTTEHGGKLSNCQSEYGDGCGVAFEFKPEPSPN